MRVLQPGNLEEALELKSRYPEALPLAGGTDVMVDLNFDRRRPPAIIDLTRVEELQGWRRNDGRMRVGAGVTYTRLVTELADTLPGLALASRTVGSPQIRNRGTVGGNLGTASAAGDALPPLLAVGASIEVASTRGRRILDLPDFLVGPKRNALEDDELVIAVDSPVSRGPEQFSKIGTRNAMVIAVATFAVALDSAGRKIGTGVGSAGPVTFRAAEAEEFMAGVLQEHDLWKTGAAVPEAELDRFGELVSGAASPIDDVRGSAAYRRHALRVMARRAFAWVWNEYRGPG